MRFIWQGGINERLSSVFIEVLQGYGGFWIDPNSGKVGLDEEESIQAVKFLAETLELEISPRINLYSDDLQTAEKFRSGKGLFLRHWPYIWSYLKEDDSEVIGKVGIVPFALGEGENTGAPCDGSWGIAISQYTKHQDKAWKAVKYLTSVASQRIFFRESSFIPSQILLLSEYNQIWERPLTDWIDAIQGPVQRPLIPEYKAASRILQEHLIAALHSSLTSSEIIEIMSEAAIETRDLIGEN